MQKKKLNTENYSLYFSSIITASILTSQVDAKKTKLTKLTPEKPNQKHGATPPPFRHTRSLPTPTRPEAHELRAAATARPKESSGAREAGRRASEPASRAASVCVAATKKTCVEEEDCSQRVCVWQPPRRRVSRKRNLCRTHPGSDRTRCAHLRPCRQSGRRRGW